MKTYTGENPYVWKGEVVITMYKLKRMETDHFSVNYVREHSVDQTILVFTWRDTCACELWISKLKQSLNCDIDVIKLQWFNKLLEISIHL